MNIGNRIKSRREELGLTLTQLADQVEVNRTTIMRYEKGDTDKFPVSLLTPFAKALRCSEEYLLGWTDEPSPAIHCTNSALRELLNNNRFTREDLDKIASYAEFILNSKNKG